MISAPTCLECGGTRWLRYFSETTNGDLEVAFRLCPCNHEPKREVNVLVKNRSGQR